MSDLWSKVLATKAGKAAPKTDANQLELGKDFSAPNPPADAPTTGESEIENPFASSAKPVGETQLNGWTAPSSTPATSLPMAPPKTRGSRASKTAAKVDAVSGAADASDAKALSRGDVKSASEKLGTPSTESAVLSVEQLNGQIKSLLEGQLGTVWVRGEISNFKAHSSGHFYFSLKDSKAQISAVMFRGNSGRLRFKPHDGLEVLMRGRVTVYEPRGNYQIVADTMEPVGAGALQKAYEQLREKLKLEGLFEPARKRAIPAFPRHVAIVTSPTGAAIRDILNVLGRRAKAVRVTVIPTIVQGEGSGVQVAAALRLAYKLSDVDVIIVGRGGGSMEDLWGFNDEHLARTIVLSPVPVISAVGHEIDFTIADFVADLRAPTPSAAAELVAKSAHELSARITQMDRLMRVALERRMHLIKQRLESFAIRLVDPRRRLQDLTLRNDDLRTRMELALQNLFQKKRHRIELGRQKLGSPDKHIKASEKKLQLLTLRLKKADELIMQNRCSRHRRLMELLDSLSPLRVVDRGYSIVTREGQVVKSENQLNIGDEVQIRLAEGNVSATISKKGNANGL